MPVMTLGGMRDQRVRLIMLTCPLPCGHHADVDVDHLPDDVEVPAVGRHYVCSSCGLPSPQSRPAWHRTEPRSVDS